MKKQLLKIGCFLSVLFLFTSCVKDDVAYLVVKLKDTESFYSRYEVSHLGSWCLCEDKQLSEYISNDGGSRSNIEKIIFPSNYVKSKLLKGESFGGLTPKNVSIPSSVTEIGDGAFSGCSSLTSIEIPSSVTKIGDEAFRGCRSLTSIEISSGVTEIGSKAFYNCSHLTSIEIPSSVTKIGSYAFSGCWSLTSIDILPSVTEIGDGAFSGCSSLEAIYIPSRVTEIGNWAFKDCSNLQLIYMEPTIPPTLLLFNPIEVLSNCPANILVPFDSGNAYKNARGWRKYASRIFEYSF